MPAFKFSMIFRYLSGTSTESAGNRSGSWSESYYQGTNTTQRINAFKELAQARALTLCRGSVVIGLRVQAVDPAGSAATFNVNYPPPNTPTLGNAGDIPQMALKCRFNGAGVVNVAKYAFACIPDPQVTGGEYNPSPGYRTLMRNFLDMLRNWTFRGADLTQTARQLDTMAADGTYTVNADLPVAVNTLVKVKRAVDSGGSLVGGIFRVQTATSLRAGKLANWTFGACTLGTITPYLIVYPVFSNPIDVVGKIGVRKIGRPSDPYRGRRSKRRV